MRGIFLAVFMIMCSFPASQGWCATYSVNEKMSHVQGSIRYSLIGSYKASFSRLEGTIVFDPKDLESAQVDFTIGVNSLQSEYSALDRIVKSRRFLNSAKHPNIYFKSRRITRKGGAYYAEGQVFLNGVWHDLSSPFQITLQNDAKGIQASGVWVLNRKDFGIIWSDWLDHGGLVVGDQITVDWTIQGKSI